MYVQLLLLHALFVIYIEEYIKIINQYSANYTMVTYKSYTFNDQLRSLYTDLMVIKFTS